MTRPFLLSAGVNDPALATPGRLAAVLSAAEFDEVIKWGHLVYFSNGPVLLIRAEANRVLFGFWRGQRLRHSSRSGRA